MTSTSTVICLSDRNLDGAKGQEKLKAAQKYCALMRDSWVNKMMESTRIGVEDSSLELVVRGLRELLGILEAMKLVSS